MKQDHLFTGEFAKILIEGGQIVNTKHDRREWLYLVRVNQESYKTQLADDGRKTKFVRMGSDNIVLDEYYCDLPRARKIFLEEVAENRQMHFTIDQNNAKTIKP